MNVYLIILVWSWFHPSPEESVLRSHMEKRMAQRDHNIEAYLYRMAKRYPKHLAPTYLTAAYFAEKARNTPELKHQYQMMSKALSLAIQFKRKSDTPSRQFYEWDSCVAMLEKQTTIMMDQLIAFGDSSKGEILSRKISKLKGEIPASMRHTDLTDNKSLLEQKVRLLTGVFNGMPSGKEDLPAYHHLMELRVLELVNLERIKQGLNPLEMDPDLVKAARYHAYDMATQNYFDHNTYDREQETLVKVGETFPRIRAFYTKSFINAENIAAGGSTAEGTYHQWFTSKGHYANMFNAASKKVGIGMMYKPESSFGYYWVLCTAL